MTPLQYKVFWIVMALLFLAFAIYPILRRLDVLIDLLRKLK